MFFKVLNYALRGLAILFVVLDIFQVGSLLWLAMVMVGLYLLVTSIQEFKSGKRGSAVASVVIGLFVVIYFSVSQFTA